MTDFRLRTPDGRLRLPKVSCTTPIKSTNFAVAVTCWVYFLTIIIVEPYNHKNVAENNDASFMVLR